jgi:hypothetical protein
MGPCEEAWLEGAMTFSDGMFEIDGAGNAVIGSTEGQLYKGDRTDSGGKGSVGGRKRPAVIAESAGMVRVTLERAASDDVDRWEEMGESTDCGGFCSALLAADEHAAETGIDSVEEQSEFHHLLADECSKRENRTLGCSWNGHALLSLQFTIKVKKELFELG